MSFDMPQLVTFAAIAVMAYCLYLAVSLKSKVPGGIIGKSWSNLLLLVALFAVGYIATPFLGALSESALRLTVAFIFFFGAVYVLVTVKLIYRVIQEVMN